MNALSHTSYEIPLSQGKTAILDPVDYALASRYQWRWTEAGAATTLGGKPVLLHRFLLQPPAGTDVVFLNSNKADCRRANLQLVDRGYAQWVDRNAYGVRSLLPLINRLEATNDRLSKRPESLAEAHQLRVDVIGEIESIDVMFKDDALVDALSPREREQWRRELASVKASKRIILRGLNLAIKGYGREILHANLAKSQQNGASLPSQDAHKPLTEEERETKRQSRHAKWVERQNVMADLLGRCTPDGLLSQVLVMCSNLEHEGRASFSTSERGLLDAIAEHLKTLEVEV